MSRPSLSLVAIAVLLGACATTPAEPRPAADLSLSAWESAAPPVDYRFDFERQCFCVLEAVEPVTITVRGDAVVEVRSRRTGAVLPLGGPASWPTLPEILAEAETAERAGQRVRVEYGPDRSSVRIEIGSLAADAGVVYLVEAIRVT